jgi:hypothetical protein
MPARRGLDAMERFASGLMIAAAALSVCADAASGADRRKRPGNPITVLMAPAEPLIAVPRVPVDTEELAVERRKPPGPSTLTVLPPANHGSHIAMAEGCGGADGSIAECFRMAASGQESGTSTPPAAMTPRGTSPGRAIMKRARSPARGGPHGHEGRSLP